MLSISSRSSEVCHSVEGISSRLISCTKYLPSDPSKASCSSLRYSSSFLHVKPPLGRMGQSCGASKSSGGSVHELCLLEDLPNPGMKEVSLPSSLGESGTLLLLRNGSEVKALSPKCTHYAAPLSKGTYDPELGTVRCPFHGACFNVDSGDIEDYPGLDSLISFKVSVRESDGKVLFQGPLENLTKGIRRTHPPLRMDPRSNEGTVIIAGGGGAAQSCVEVLRGPECKFRGEIIIVSKENSLPYDRPKLSKALGVSPEEIRLREPSFFKDRDIELKLGVSLSSIHPEDKCIGLSDGSKLSYTKLVLATGTVPRVLDIPGSGLKNIFVLRTPKDANAIVTNATGRRVVVVGSSFIGTEVAASLVGKAAEVTLVGSSKYLFEKTLGKEIGSLVQDMHEKKGVKFALGVSPVEFKSSDGITIESISLSDGTEIQTDVVVLGIGVTPNTRDYLGTSGLASDDRGYLMVNERMETNVEGIYAVGDVAKFPLFTHGNREVSIGHWGLAKSMGRVAAFNVSSYKSDSPKTLLRSVPFFWTVQYGKSLRVAGFADAYEDIFVDGSIAEGKFAAFYIKDGRVVSVATLMRDPLAAKFADLTRKGKSLSKEGISDWILSSA